MSYLIFGIVFSLISWYITRDQYKRKLEKVQKQLKESNDLRFDNMAKLLNKNITLLRKIEELQSEIVVLKSMKGDKK